MALFRLCIRLSLVCVLPLAAADPETQPKKPGAKAAAKPEPSAVVDPKGRHHPRPLHPPERQRGLRLDNLFDRAYAEHISRNTSMIPGYLMPSIRVNEPGRTFWVKATLTFGR